MKSTILTANLLKTLQKHGVKRFKNGEFEIEFQDDAQIPFAKPDLLNNTGIIPNTPLIQDMTQDEIMFHSTDGGGSNPQADDPDQGGVESSSESKRKTA